MMTGPGTNTYLVGARDPILIDTGAGVAGYVPIFADYVKSRGWTRPSRVLLTHRHRDHLGGVEHLRERFGRLPVSKMIWKDEGLPDGTQVVFRSDRDGISNLYAARVADGSLWRLTNVLGGAFSPDVGADGRTLAFSNYDSGGYDVHIMQADLADPPPAEAFDDPYPPQRPVPAAVDAPDKPYRPIGTLLPRFWSPYLASADDEFRYGVLTDLAVHIRDGAPIPLAMGHVNVIWQGDANRAAIELLPHASVPPLTVNVTGSETLSVRELATRLGQRLDVAPRFTGTESADALLSDSARMHQLVGAPETAVDRMLDWVADWVAARRPVLGKPTHFEARDGSF